MNLGGTRLSFISKVNGIRPSTCTTSWITSIRTTVSITKSRSDGQLRGKEPSVQVERIELDGKYEKPQKLYEKLNGDIQHVVKCYTSSCSPLVLPATVGKPRGSSKPDGERRPMQVVAVRFGLRLLL